jgi:hypothetical protein
VVENSGPHADNTVSENQGPERGNRDGFNSLAFQTRSTLGQREKQGIQGLALRVTSTLAVFI